MLPTKPAEPAKTKIPVQVEAEIKVLVHKAQVLLRFQIAKLLVLAMYRNDPE